MMISYLKKQLAAALVIITCFGIGVSFVRAETWKEFADSQKEKIEDRTVGRVKTKFQNKVDEVKKVGDSYRNVGKNWKNGIQNGLQSQQSGSGNIVDGMIQKADEKTGGTVSAVRDTYNSAQNLKSSFEKASSDFKNMDNTIKNQVRQQAESTWDNMAGGTIREVQGTINEVKGMKDEFKNAGQEFKNAGGDLKTEAKRQALQGVDSATGGVIGEVKGTIDDVKGLGQDLRGFSNVPGKIKTNMINRVDSELKDTLQVMNITGDFKSKAGIAAALGDVKSMAQQSFGGAAQFDADHLFGGGIVQKLVDEFAKHSIGSIADKGGAFSSIQSAIGGLSPGGGFLGEDLKMLGDAQADFNALRNHNLSQRAGNMMSQIQSDVQQMVAGKVAGVVNGAGNLIKKNQVQLKISGMPHGGVINFGEKSASIGDKYGSITAFHEGADGMADMIGSIGQGLGQLMDPRAMTALQMQSFFSKVGAGIPSIDPLNGALGVFNVESVYGHSYEYEDMRDLNMQYCSAMGVSDESWRAPIQNGTKTAGEYCCEQWLDVQAHSLNTMIGLLTSPGNIVDALTSAALMKKYCCETSPGICDTLGAKKADCVNGALAGGSSAEDSWIQCGIECGNSGYADLVYNPETGYDPQQVEEVIKGCYQTEAWEPSNTVLSSSEMSPIVPAGVKGILSGAQEKMNTAANLMSGASGRVTETTQNVMQVGTGQVNEWMNPVKETADSVVGAGQENVGGLLSGVRGGISDAISFKNQQIQSVGSSVGTAVSPAAGNASSGLSDVSNTVGETHNAVGSLRGSLQGLSNELGGIGQ